MDDLSQFRHHRLDVKNVIIVLRVPITLSMQRQHEHTRIVRITVPGDDQLASIG